MLNAFNNYFASVSRKLDENSPNLEPSYQNQSIPPNECSGIFEGLKEIKQDKNLITFKMLKNERILISPML